MEKFKYGPLVYNNIDDEDDSGNFWWPGLPPVKYDSMGIPIDSRGMQCLPLQSPVHPAYTIKDSVFHEALNDYLPSIAEWKEWFADHFIEATDSQIKKLILKWYAKQRDKSSKFFKLQQQVNTLDEMVEIIWRQDESK